MSGECRPLISEADTGRSTYLRVVYREEGDMRVVITLYPGRRQRYEG